jgi:hypothetical protein
VIGDWGFDEGKWKHGNIETRKCQNAIATKMLEKMKELGDVKFIVNVGDSFYPRGVTSQNDPQWDYKWRDVYDKELRSIPWYSVYGNHDYQGDPCACGSGAHDCAQVNYNISDLDHFYMPGYTWYKEHPELGLEVVALDMNWDAWTWNSTATPEYQKPDDCRYSPCKYKCWGSLQARLYESLDLFNKRYNKSEAKNLVVFSHYPTDYFSRSRPEFIEKLRDDSRHHIEYFGGHRHNVDNTSTTSTKPNNNWLVGGGGGWSCEPLTYMNPPQQGFVVIEISNDEHATMTTYPVFVDPWVCCPKPDAVRLKRK